MPSNKDNQKWLNKKYYNSYLITKHTPRAANGRHITACNIIRALNSIWGIINEKEKKPSSKRRVLTESFNSKLKRWIHENIPPRKEAKHHPHCSPAYAFIPPTPWAINRQINNPYTSQTSASQTRHESPRENSQGHQIPQNETSPMASSSSSSSIHPSSQEKTCQQSRGLGQRGAAVVEA